MHMVFVRDIPSSCHKKRPSYFKTIRLLGKALEQKWAHGHERSRKPGNA